LGRKANSPDRTVVVARTGNGYLRRTTSGKKIATTKK